VKRAAWFCSTRGQRAGLLRTAALRVTGTLGVLGEAALRGLVDLAPAIDRLLKTNFHFSPGLMKDVLDRFGRRQECLRSRQECLRHEADVLTSRESALVKKAAPRHPRTNKQKPPGDILITEN